MVVWLGSWEARMSEGCRCLGFGGSPHLEGQRLLQKAVPDGDGHSGADGARLRSQMQPDPRKKPVNALAGALSSPFAALPQFHWAGVVCRWVEVHALASTVVLVPAWR